MRPRFTEYLSRDQMNGIQARLDRAVTQEVLDVMGVTWEHLMTADRHTERPELWKKFLTLRVQMAFCFQEERDAWRWVAAAKRGTIYGAHGIKPIKAARLKWSEVGKLMLPAGPKGAFHRDGVSPQQASDWWHKIERVLEERRTINYANTGAHTQAHLRREKSETD